MPGNPFVKAITRCFLRFLAKLTGQISLKYGFFHKLFFFKDLDRLLALAFVWRDYALDLIVAFFVLHLWKITLV